MKNQRTEKTNKMIGSPIRRKLSTDMERESVCVCASESERVSERVRVRDRVCERVCVNSRVDEDGVAVICYDCYGNEQPNEAANNK